MEALYNRQIYGETTAIKIEAMGSTAVGIANRWALGWPKRVLSLLVNHQFMEKLIAQTELEKDILANETALKHLSPREILEMHGVSQEPPEAIQHAG
ncbi:hypothetical protein [Acidovorax carolinensis]|uniref:hypothetical protein n=1 Tax=Acidovorax carolinensis TaxID=553814 RepID=UPI0013905BBE|nr:hypothetical protein [Acidovorax carolinensis]